MDTRKLEQLLHYFKKQVAKLPRIPGDSSSIEITLTAFKKWADRFQRTLVSLNEFHHEYKEVDTKAIECRDYVISSIKEMIYKEFIQNITLGNKSAYTTLRNRISELFCIEFVNYAREQAETINLRNKTLQAVLDEAILHHGKPIIDYLRNDVFDEVTNADPVYMLMFACKHHVDIDVFRLILKKSDDLNPKIEADRDLFSYMIRKRCPLLDAKTRLHWLMYEAMLRNDQLTLNTLAKSWPSYYRDRDNINPNFTPEAFQEFLGETHKPTDKEHANLRNALKHMERIDLISKETQSEMLCYLDRSKVGNLQVPDSNLLRMQECFLSYLTQQIEYAQKLMQELQQLREGFKLFAVPAPVDASQPAPVTTFKLSTV